MSSEEKKEWGFLDLACITVAFGLAKIIASELPKMPTMSFVPALAISVVEVFLMLLFAGLVGSGAAWGIRKLMKEEPPTSP